MINIADKFHAATEEGVVASAKEIKDYQLGKDQETLNQEFNAYMNTPPEKEVVGVLTAADEAPSSPSADDLYINTDENKLYKYSGSAWVEETPSEDIVYVTADTSHLYLWNGTEYTDVTGQEVDGIIYIESLSELNAFTTPTYKTVAKSSSGAMQYWTFIVETMGTKVTQTLSNKSGYQWRNKSGNNAWGAWNIFSYAKKMAEVTYYDPGEAINVWLGPNTLYILENWVSTTTFTLGTPASGEPSEYHVIIKAGASETDPTISWPQDIEWNGGSAPTIVAGNTYEVSIMNGIALFVEIEPQTQSQS